MQLALRIGQFPILGGIPMPIGADPPGRVGAHQVERGLQQTVDLSTVAGIIAQFSFGHPYYPAEAARRLMLVS